ncbi:MAG: DUF58 domain-containing protein [Candidatus Riflebacteria bacterium]|nr:DUF58 domain-containing protein [Candidatus Riflebacteria bacterium]
MNEQFREFLRAGEQAGRRFRMAIPQRLPMGAGGNAIGRRGGRSLEFLDYRSYQPGDDLRHLDWNAFARTDRLTVKLFREEVNPHVDILIDGSASMNLPGSRKAEAVLGLAALLVRSAANAGFTWRSWIAAEGCRPVGNGHISPEKWQGVEFSWPHDLEASFRRLPPSWKPRGIRIVLTDLLWPGDPAATLWPIASGSALTLLVQVLAASDHDGPEIGPIRLLDVESGETREVLVDDGVQTRYREAFDRHRLSWSQTCRRLQTIFTSFTAETLLTDWNLSELLSIDFLRVESSA